ncbi:unnamed protein product [Owenia fusiformis]|uniref:Uncharacterized protein n=1 Tax=Owenia fusiformis TaxID=6347 RepID=A0A8S4N322_OWEFU|nr:unnamed protein product [Owenia fusiformis]
MYSIMKTLGYSGKQPELASGDHVGILKKKMANTSRKRTSTFSMKDRWSRETSDKLRENYSPKPPLRTTRIYIKNGQTYSYKLGIHFENFKKYLEIIHADGEKYERLKHEMYKDDPSESKTDSFDQNLDMIYRLSSPRKLNPISKYDRPRNTPRVCELPDKKVALFVPSSKLESIWKSTLRNGDSATDMVTKKYNTEDKNVSKSMDHIDNNKGSIITSDNGKNRRKSKFSVSASLPPIKSSETHKNNRLKCETYNNGVSYETDIPSIPNINNKSTFSSLSKNKTVHNNLTLQNNKPSDKKSTNALRKQSKRVERHGEQISNNNVSDDKNKYGMHTRKEIQQSILGCSETRSDSDRFSGDDPRNKAPKYRYIFTSSPTPVRVYVHYISEEQQNSKAIKPRNMSQRTSLSSESTFSIPRAADEARAKLTSNSRKLLANRLVYDKQCLSFHPPEVSFRNMSRTALVTLKAARHVRNHLL